LTCLCFNVTLGTQSVQIVGTNAAPEFPSSLILPIFMLTTLAALALHKKRRTQIAEEPKSTHN